jgi:hypothetical protein
MDYYETVKLYHPYYMLCEQQNVARYRPSGFHPVCLNDTFKSGRYKIFHNLGGGILLFGLQKTESAPTRKLLFMILLTCNRHDQWGSLKILTAGSSLELAIFNVCKSMPWKANA